MIENKSRDYETPLAQSDNIDKPIDYSDLAKTIKHDKEKIKAIEEMNEQFNMYLNKAKNFLKNWENENAYKEIRDLVEIIINDDYIINDLEDENITGIKDLVQIVISSTSENDENLNYIKNNYNEFNNLTFVNPLEKD